MIMAFLHPGLQFSSSFLATLMIFTLVTLPITPLWAETGQSKKQTEKANSNSSVLPPGIYLYGESQQPDQLGKEYIVLEVTEKRLLGVLYMPRSSFSCFEGEIANHQLKMTVDTAYDDETHSYAIALDSTSPVASQQEQFQIPFHLKGYHPLEDISENDKRMLETCREVF